MKLTAQICTWLGLCLLFVCCHKQEQLAYPIMGNLKLGDHAVGFNTLFLYDESRSAIPFSDWEGKLYANQASSKGRQFQINIWYPATAGSGVPMTYGDYVELMGRQTNFNNSEEQKQFAKQLFIKQTNDLGGNRKFTAQQLTTLTELNVVSKSQAEIKKGKFPVVIFPNGSSPAFQSIMCEFLASHGYVVVAFAAKGRFAFGLETSTIGLETAVDDLEFVMSKLSELPYTDMKQVGLLANAISSSICALAISKNNKIKGMVSLEGGLPSSFEQGLLKQSVFYEPAHIQVPILFIYAPHPAINPKYTFHLKHAQRYYAHFPEMSEFAMLNYGMFDSMIPEIIGKQKGNTQKGFEQANVLALRFLNHVLKQEQLEVFDDDFKRIAKPTIDTMFIREAIPTAPSIAIMKDLFLRKGFKAIDSTYQDLVRKGNQFPFSKTFYPALRDWLAWKKDPDYVFRKQLYKLALNSYPQSAKINYNFAYYCQKTGKNEQAITYYQKAIQLLTTDHQSDLSQAERNRIKAYAEEGLNELKEGIN